MMDGRWTRSSLGLFIGLLFLGKCDRMNKWPVQQFWEISWCVKIIRTGKWADCKLLAQQVRTALQSQVASFIGFLGLVCWWVCCIWICSFLALINHLMLGIHTEETRRERDTCTPMFIAALFIIASTWKQPRCPSADEWIRKQWYIYTMEYYSAIKKNTFESVLMR